MAHLPSRFCLERDWTGSLPNTALRPCAEYPRAMRLLNGDLSCPEAAQRPPGDAKYSRIPMRSRMGDTHQATGSTFETQCYRAFLTRALPVGKRDQHHLIRACPTSLIR